MYQAVSMIASQSAQVPKVWNIYILTDISFSISCLKLELLLKINRLRVIQTQFRYSLYQTLHNTLNFKPIITHSEITLSLESGNQKRPTDIFRSFFEVGSPMIVCPCHRNDFANAKCAEKLLVFVKNQED